MWHSHEYIRRTCYIKHCYVILSLSFINRTIRTEWYKSADSTLSKHIQYMMTVTITELKLVGITKCHIVLYIIRIPCITVLIIQRRSIIVQWWYHLTMWWWIQPGSMKVYLVFVIQCYSWVRNDRFEQICGNSPNIIACVIVRVTFDFTS